MPCNDTGVNARTCTCIVFSSFDWRGFMQTTVAHNRPVVRPRVIFFHALALVLGFSLIFTLLGVSVGMLGNRVLYDVMPIITRAGAILLIVFAIKVAHVRMNILGWAITALIFGGVAYGLDQYQFDPAIRALDALIIALAVFSGAGWDRFVLAVFAVLLAGLSFFTSDSFTVPLKIAESALIALTIYFGNITDLFDREFRMDMGDKFGSESTYWRSGLVGIIFAAGWTPCVGPILSAILLLAAQEQTWAQGGLLLASYSLGLGAPFLLAGAFFSKLTVYLPRFYKWLPTISIISGALLILIALLLYTDTLARLAQFGSFLSFEQNLVGEGGMANISLVLAFLGGLVSFLSPCVLPLVPAYLGYLSGTAVGATNVAMEEAA
ncbi:MAG TPA: hypothetical protein EYP25_08240 [Anaerolineae bacterium]|nr:hypothetical protein [Anaerolineae bacterium]HIQ11367.1 hypothetical protein [Caldilineales bacterium]